MALSKHQIDTFWKEGHLTIPDFIDTAQVDEIDRSFQRLFRTRAGWKEGDFYDIAGLDQGDEFKLPQLLHPAKYAPELLRTAFWANAEAVAKALLGADARFSFDHAISKPPHPTPPPLAPGPGVPPGREPCGEHYYLAAPAGRGRGERLPDLRSGEPYRADADSPQLPRRQADRGPGGGRGRSGQGRDGAAAQGLRLDPPQPHTALCRARSVNRPRKVYSLLFAVQKPEPVVAVDYPWNVDKPTARLERKRAYEQRWSNRAQRRIKNALSSTLHRVVG